MVALGGEEFPYVTQEQRDARLGKHALGVVVAALLLEVGLAPPRVAPYLLPRWALVTVQEVLPAKVAALARGERGDGQRGLAELAVAAAV